MSELALKLIKEAKEKRLTRLDLGNCGLTELPEELFELDWLEELNLSNRWYEYRFIDGSFRYEEHKSINPYNGNRNKFYKINSGIKKLTKLKKLNLSQTSSTFQSKIKNIDFLIYLVNLKWLNLSYLGVENLSSISSLFSLEWIDLSGNRLSDLEPIANLKKLKYISCCEMRLLTDLNPLSNLVNLEEAYFYNSRINIRNFYNRDRSSYILNPFKLQQKLRVLDLFNLNIEDISPISNLKHLGCLSISHNNHIRDFSPISKLENLTYLDACGCNIGNIYFLRELVNIQYLDISHNNVNNLSPLESLSNLHFLNIRHNREIKDISHVKYLNKLKSLDLSDIFDLNDLSPLENLFSLTELKIGNSGIYGIDINPIKDLINLEVFEASKSGVRDISPLKNLINLKSLNLGSTKISNIESLRNCKNLVKVNIDYCFKVKDLSPLRGIMEKGVQLNRSIITNGRLWFNNPPSFIYEKGQEAILRYWQELENKETITNNQTKLIFVGNSRAGKTSLWQFLKDKIYNEQADSTHGIKTEIWDSEPLETEDNQNLAAHIWDFGGQEYYHATHRLFLADNAVYVLVWEKDSNKQGTRLEKFKLDDDPHGEIEEVELEHFPASYWLENIAYFAGKHCPVLIVQNKVDDEAQKANYTEGVSETSDCFHLSVQNAFGFQQGNLTLKRYDLRFQDFKERLLELLRKNATAFKLVKYYAQVREALEAKARDTEYIAVSELKDIALQFDETPDLENLLAYLKSFTNTVLYFPQNDLLKDRLYLNPTHISRDIYKILNKIVRENNGKFDITHIQTRLNCDAPEAERFVALMREFDLIFEKEHDSKPIFIAPQYLKEKDKLGINIAVLSKQLKLKPAFYLRFASFVPRSMMSRFIAHNGQYTTDETYWKNGLIYSSKETDASIKVEYTPETRTFCIDVQNLDIQAVDMQNIVAQFVKLNNSDDKIEISNDGSVYFELRKIYQAHNQKRQEIDNFEGQYTPLSNFDWLFEKYKTRIMIEMTLKALKTEVNNSIRKANTKQAMDVVATWAHENNREQLIKDINLLRGQLTGLNRQQILGTLSYSELRIEEAKVNSQLIDLLNTLEETLPDEEAPTPTQTISNGILKILMLTANPTNQARLRLDSEHSNILQKLQGKQSQFEFVIKKGVSKSEFQELTAKVKPAILHFSGHGESAEYGTGGLILQDMDGKEDILPPKGLSLLFRFFKSENIIIKVAILNACYSEEQAQAICPHVPYVIGTTLNIGDTAAIAFSTGFYYKLAENGTIEQAFNAGITRAAMDGADETYFALYKDGIKMPISF